MPKLPRNVPIPDDPTSLSKDQVDAMLSVAHRRFIAPGTRVRIHSKSDRLNGLTGTVTTAHDSTAWVTLDPVDADDLHPEEIRFYDGELEKIGFDHEHFQESEEFDPDAPEPYAAALDYITPLKELGYRQIAGSWHKYMHGDGYPWKGSLQIRVTPWGTAAYVAVGYRRKQHHEDILHAALPAIDILDMLREIEAMANTAESVSDLTSKLQARAFNGSRIESPDLIRRLFGESVPDNPDEDTSRLINQLQDDARVVNAFIENTGLILRRRPSGERKAYEFTSGWRTPDDDIQYVVFLEKLADGSWAVSAIGTKFFEREDGNRYWQDFEIKQAWDIPAGVDDAQLSAYAQDVWIQLQRHRGPDEYAPPEYGVEEGVDDINFDAYAKDSAGYNPVQLLTSKEVRAWIREAGYKVNTVYRSKRTTGWNFTATPGSTDVFNAFRDNPEKEEYRVLDLIREKLVQRFPAYTEFELLKRLYLHVWNWSGDTGADPANSRNYVLYVEIQPTDADKRKGGALPAPVDEAVSDPDDPEAFLKDLRVAGMGDAVDVKCPHCGHEKQILKSWPDIDLKVLRLGSKCEQCGEFVPFNNFYVRESEALDDFDPERYAKTTFDPNQFLEAAGWVKDDKRPLAADGGGYKKVMPLPRQYVMGSFVFTKLKFIIYLLDERDRSAHIAIYFVNDQEQGLPVGNGWTLVGQKRFAFDKWDDDLRLGNAVKDGWDTSMPLRKFVVGIIQLVSTLPWPDKPHSTLVAASHMEDAVSKYVADLNNASNQPLGPAPQQESLDAPDGYVKSLGTLAHVAARFGMRRSTANSHSELFVRDVPLHYPMQLYFQGKEPVARSARVFLYRSMEARPMVRLGAWLVLEGGGVYKLWSCEQRYRSEAAAALHLNEAIAYLFQSLDDSMEGHRQIMLRDIIGMGVTPFMRRAADEDEDPE
jgi:hypothetical protein